MAWIGSPTSALVRSRPISSVHHNTSSHPTKVTGGEKCCYINQNKRETLFYRFPKSSTLSRKMLTTSRTFFLFGPKSAGKVHFFLVTGDSPCSAGTGVVSQVKTARGVMLTAPNNLATRLRISRAISLLPLYTFMAWTGTSLPLHLPFLRADILQVMGEWVHDLPSKRDPFLLVDVV